MRDLLSDNAAFHEQLESIQGPLISAVTPAGLRPRVREVSSLISWVFCYLAYVAMGTNDELTRDLITYCRLIIQEALRHGGELTIQPRSVPWAQYNSHWYPIKQWFQGTCQQPTGVGAGITHSSGQCVRPGTEVTVLILEEAPSTMCASPAASGTRPRIVKTSHRTHLTSADYNLKHHSTQDHRQNINSLIHLLSWPACYYYKYCYW